MQSRPLRVDDRRIVANVARGDGWSEPPPPQAAGAAMVDVDLQRGTRWTSDALDGHASIGAFARLSLQLLGAGAPAMLLRRAQRAALDEVRHAELCFALASRFSGVNLSAGPLPLPSTMPIAYELTTIACEALLDGMVAQSLAAAEARARLRHTEDEQERVALVTIARDEARHAKLGEAIVCWCLDAGGPAVVTALLDALDRVPAVTAPPALDPGAAARMQRAVAEHVRTMLSGRAITRSA